MDRTVYALVEMMSQWFRPRYNTRIQMLEFQIRMLRSRIDASRIVPTPKEKAELIRLGTLLDHDVLDIIHVVRPETYRTWLRHRSRGYIFKKLGRPATPRAIRDLVCRFARENLRWGSRRIVGELKKLSIRIGITTVRDILKAEDIFSEPTKGKGRGHIPWKTFIEANMESLLACDFFTKPIHTMSGGIDAYFLVFIHLGSRKMFCSPVSYHPNEKWIIQQARNTVYWLDDLGIQAKYLVHDRDSKFSLRFRQFWKSDSVRCIRTPFKASKANAYCEAVIGSLKKEALNHIVCFSSKQADYVVRTWITHYNTERPHRGQGMNNSVLDKSRVSKSRGVVKGRRKLGGLITEYYREAA